MTLDDLRILGADVDEGLSRCMNNEEFYLKMVGKLLDDEKIDLLGKALKEGNLEKSFELAHALKGVASNLSLTPLAENLSKITDLLRERTDTDYNGIYDSIIDIRNKMAELK